MIFPIDINRRIANKSRIAGDNLIQLVVSIAFVGNFIGIFLMNWVVDSFLGGGMVKAIVLLLLIDLVVGIFVFRFVIFDENAKISEYMNFENDSFSKYMNVRKDVNHSVTVNEQKVSVIEFANGSASCVLEFRFGSNDNEKSKRTAAVFQEIYKTIALYGFEARTVVMSEDFSNSNEFRDYMKTINQIQSKKLKDAMVAASGAVLKYSADRSSVNCIYLTVRSLNSYSRAELETIMNRIINLVIENHTAFRSVQFLGIEELLEFYRSFYGIAAIDLSMMKTIEMSQEVNDGYGKIVNIYGMETESGKFYGAKDNQQIFKSKERNK